MKSRQSRVIALALAATLVGRSGALGANGGEAELGRRFMLEVRSQLPLIDDPAVTEYVERVGRRLVGVLGSQQFEYHFYVVQSPELNAFAVPGGYVFVFSGLLARAGNDDELAGVLGHEMGHVSGHHFLRQQSEGQVWNYAALLGILLSAVHPVLAAGAVAAAQTAQLKYSREFEQEADYLGLRYTSQAGYDPHALGSFFKTLLAEQRVNPAGVPAYMLTHPMTEERVAHVETTISAERLRTPKGRPAASPDMAEVQAVARAVAEPGEVVVSRYRRQAEERPDDAERQFLLGRVYQTLGQLEAARTALERCRDLGGLGGRVDRPLGAIYNALARWFFRLPVRDVDCDFRLVRRRALQRISLSASSGAICVELVHKLAAAGCAFREVPVHHYERPHGRSQFFTPRRIAHTVLEFFALWWNVVVSRFVFGTPRPTENLLQTDTQDQ